MLLSINIDPLLSQMVILALVIIVLGFIFKLLKQPSVIGYICAGVLMGPHFLGVLNDPEVVSNMGSIGLILLLFFIGLEIELPKLISRWKISVFGTVTQVALSIFFTFLIGQYFDWPINRILLLGFVISLSSTAVIIKLLNERNETQTTTGQNVIGILIAQDVIIIPMLIAVNYLGGNEMDMMMLLKQVIGGLIFIGTIAYIIHRKKISLPFQKIIISDHELQVFVAFSLCFGFAVLAAFLELSPALGAFLAGIIISSSRSTKWVHDSLHAFRVIFVAQFFVYVGMLVDLHFFREHIQQIALILAGIFLINNLINSVIIKQFGSTWKESVYAGALLSQVGEFGFILAAAGFQSGMINNFGHQMAIIVIALSLLFSPMWIWLAEKITKRNLNLSSH